MKLTVGPLPPGVYWRRRAIVGGVVVLAGLMLWASCGGGSAPDDRKVSDAASADQRSRADVDPTVTIQVPTTGEPPASSAPPPASSAAAPPPSVAAIAPPCADADLSLTAAPDQPVQFRGAYLKFTLKVKNVSAQDCVRDLGADYQELYLQVGAAKVWSSDQCDPLKGSKPTVMKPGIEMSFETTWNGKATNTSCVNREVPPAGKYQLVGRLATKISDPVQIQLT
ncbi:hypothetical protein [Dactylosporangium sp. CA-092794]|uniref:hypothetical protein n=1 Tax=Dactylosporangium sp. CA-092794 TaxID=3239929 RepID=UPI003D8E9206